MNINRNTWHYKYLLNNNSVGSKNKELFENNYGDICTYVRTLLITGFKDILTVIFIFSFVVLLLSLVLYGIFWGPINLAWYMISGDVLSYNYTNIISSLFVDAGLLLFGLGYIFWKWLKKVLGVIKEKYRNIKPIKSEPSLIYTYLKSVKDKTCVLIKFE